MAVWNIGVGVASPVRYSISFLNIWMVVYTTINFCDPYSFSVNIIHYLSPLFTICHHYSLSAHMSMIV